MSVVFNHELAGGKEIRFPPAVEPIRRNYSAMARAYTS